MPAIYPILFFAALLGWFIYYLRFMPKKQTVEQDEPRRSISYTPEAGAMSLDEIDMLNQVNLYRKGKGLSELKPDRLAKQLADEHLNYMINTKFGHDNFESRSATLINHGAVRVNENVCYGFSTTNSTMHAYIESDGHRGNLEIENVTHIGIASKKVNNTIWNVQLFVRFQEKTI